MRVTKFPEIFASYLFVRGEVEYPRPCSQASQTPFVGPALRPPASQKVQKGKTGKARAKERKKGERETYLL